MFTCLLPCVLKTLFSGMFYEFNISCPTEIDFSFVSERQYAYHRPLRRTLLRSVPHSSNKTAKTKVAKIGFIIFFCASALLPLVKPAGQLILL
jgi:hypothetical protein